MLPASGVRVYLALGATDMRKSIDGLSILVSQHLQLDPFAGHLFGFCNRSRTIIKLLYWDRNGFCLWHKRLDARYSAGRPGRPRCWPSTQGSSPGCSTVLIP